MAQSHSATPIVTNTSHSGMMSQHLSLAAQREMTPLLHRDSLDIHRHHLADEKQHKTNPLLANTRDSFVLSKGRFEQYPKGQFLSQPVFSRLTFGGLSPIQDASPPDVRHTTSKCQVKTKQDQQVTAFVPEKKTPEQIKIPSKLTEVRGHPDNDHDCPICAVERPRTVAARA
ncbi:hypothetical protein ANO11243_021500 [Dothideomycetidae sp. 11243]|nr:hypothetical protein ANO11243_021500 [fungal sp. No.11243]